MPKVHYDFRYNLAGGNIDDLNVNKERNTGLTLADVITDKLGANIWRLSDPWRHMGGKL
jgi:hypothetical protein